MGTHAEWTENLMADIDSMYQSRAELDELRKVLVSELLSDARDLVEKLRREHQQRATELREWLGEFGGDVRKAAKMWQDRANHPTKGRSRPEEFSEAQGKREKKKGK
jgi:hypothetical protein